MTRQEAIDKAYNMDYTAYDEISGCNVEEFIDELFDDIGNCSNCKYYDKRSEDTDNLCIIQGIKHIPEWYCADFKRKENR